MVKARTTAPLATESTTEPAAATTALRETATPARETTTAAVTVTAVLAVPGPLSMADMVPPPVPVVGALMRAGSACADVGARGAEAGDEHRRGHDDADQGDRSEEDLARPVEGAVALPGGRGSDLEEAEQLGEHRAGDDAAARKEPGGEPEEGRERHCEEGLAVGIGLPPDD